MSNFYHQKHSNFSFFSSWVSLKGSFRSQTSKSNGILPSITVVILLVTSKENLDLGQMTYVKEDFCPMVSPAAFWDKICWILLGDRYHLWCVYTYCSKLFYPPRMSLPFLFALSSHLYLLLLKCVFGKGAPVSLSPYISAVQKVKSTEIFLYFDYKVPTWRYWKWKTLTQVLL